VSRKRNPANLSTEYVCHLAHLAVYIWQTTIEGGFIVKLCSKWDLVPRAFAFEGHEESLVRLRMGGLFFVLDPHEARKFAREILAVADEADSADSRQRPKTGCELL
jgi:hypothetical protein